MRAETGKKATMLCIGATAVLALVACATGSGTGPHPRPRNLMGATLNGASVVPPTISSGRGEAYLSYDRASRTLSWTVTYSALSGPATEAHFHGPALAGQGGPIALSLVAPGATPASPLRGTAELDEQRAADLLAGKWYVDIHTTVNPNGEIRGQVLPK
jgi:hypothetical protein